jgi:hypothetical protein
MLASNGGQGERGEGEMRKAKMEMVEGPVRRRRREAREREKERGVCVGGVTNGIEAFARRLPFLQKEDGHEWEKMAEGRKEGEKETGRKGKKEKKAEARTYERRKEEEGGGLKEERTSKGAWGVTKVRNARVGGSEGVRLEEAKDYLPTNHCHSLLDRPCELSYCTIIQKRKGSKVRVVQTITVLPRKPYKKRKKMARACCTKNHGAEKGTRTRRV